MKNKYLLRIGPVVREVTVVNSCMYTGPIFRTVVALKRKLDDVCEEEIFRIGEELGLERFSPEKSVKTDDRSYEVEYGFRDKYFVNPNDILGSEHVWLRINKDNQFVELQPEMKKVLEGKGSMRKVTDEEVVAYVNTLLHPIVQYLERKD